MATSSNEAKYRFIGALCRSDFDESVELSIPAETLCTILSEPSGRLAEDIVSKICAGSSARFLQLLHGGGFTPRKHPRVVVGMRTSGAARRWVVQTPCKQPFAYMMEADRPLLAGGFKRRRSAFFKADALASVFGIGDLLAELFVREALPYCLDCQAVTQQSNLRDLVGRLAHKLQNSAVPSGCVLALAVPLADFSKKPAALPLRVCLEMLGSESFVLAGKFLRAGAETAQFCLDESIESCLEKGGDCAAVIETALLPLGREAELQLEKTAKRLFDSSVECLLAFEIEADSQNANLAAHLSQLCACPNCGKLFEPVAGDVLAHLRSLLFCEVCHGSGTAGKGGGDECPACRGTGLQAPVWAWSLGGVQLCEFSALRMTDFEKWCRAQARDLPAGLQGPVQELAAIAARLVEFGFGDYRLGHPGAALSRGEAIRARLLILLQAGLNDALVVFDRVFSGFLKWEAERYLPLLAELKHLGNTCLLAGDGELTGAHSDLLMVFDEEAESQPVFLGSPREYANFRARAQDAEPEALAARSDRSRRTTETIVVKGLEASVWRGVELEIPKGCLVCLRGPSGSGKSVLLDELRRIKLAGFKQSEQLESQELHASQAACLLSLSGIYPLIVRVLAGTREAHLRGFTEQSFSLAPGGRRCARCRGAGVVRAVEELTWVDADSGGIGADLLTECPVCLGGRFEPEILKVRYRNRSPAEIFELSVNEAVSFFWEHEQIARRLDLLGSLGFAEHALGYGWLEMSRAEKQRVRLFNVVHRYLSPAAGKRRAPVSPVLFLLDEPCRGLECRELVMAAALLAKLVAKGHTVICADNSARFWPMSDYVIELDVSCGEEGRRAIVVSRGWAGEYKAAR